MSDREAAFRAANAQAFITAFREALAETAQAAGLVVRTDLHSPWLEEAGTYPEGSRGWWVTAGLKPQFRNPPDLTGRQPDEYTPASTWPAYVTVSHESGGEDEPSTSLLDVEVRGTGAHLAQPLAVMAVAVVTAWLHDRDTRIEALRERKALLATELERVTAELFQLDGISD